MYLHLPMEEVLDLTGVLHISKLSRKAIYSSGFIPFFVILPSGEGNYTARKNKILQSADPFFRVFPERSDVTIKAFKNREDAQAFVQNGYKE